MAPLDYKGSKVVLAPMVRAGELPLRLMALKYGADLVWGPETIDDKMISAVRSENPFTGCIIFRRPPKYSIVYRLHRSERSKHIFQVGSRTPEKLVQACKVVAHDVAGFDLNCGCPTADAKAQGMGAALLQEPELIVKLLKSLVREIGIPYNLGISCKIRLLESQELTENLVRMVCGTGIQLLTIHCRTPRMRDSHRALHERLPNLIEICRAASVACYINGDLIHRDQARLLINSFDVDGAMIARSARENPSCFKGLPLSNPIDVVREISNIAYTTESPLPNLKLVLSSILSRHKPRDLGLKVSQVRTYKELFQLL